MKNIGFLIFVLLASTAFCWSNESAGGCDQVKYENHNQADYGPLRVRTIQGTIVNDTDKAIIPNMCIALFSENNHKLVTTARSGNDGRYSFIHIKSGRYRLVVTSTPFCPPNVPIQVVNWPEGGFTSSRKIYLHLKLPAIDTCSYSYYR